MHQRPYQPVFLFSLLLFALIAFKSAWMSDDSFITLRTVRNVLDGFGPVWNISERVQAYTHPLWMGVLVLASAITGEFYYTTLAISLLIGIAAFWIVVHKTAIDWLSALLGVLS
jgi:arabinofuranosyltransferase